MRRVGRDYRYWRADLRPIWGRVSRPTEATEDLRRATHLNDLPATSELVVEFFLQSRDDGRVVALFDPVLSADNNLPRFRVPEDEHLLSRESDDEHRDVVLEDFPCRDLRKM